MLSEGAKEKAARYIGRVILIFIGAAISGVGIGFLLVPHNLLTGGVSGTSILLSYIIPVNAGVWIVLLNIPLFIIAWKKIDASFCILSVVGTIGLAISVAIFTNIHSPIYVGDPLLSALFGGMLTGGGTGLCIRARGSQGGTDIISVVVRRRFSLNVGTANFYMNLVIVGILAVKFGVEIGLLTIFSLFIAAKACDRVVTGLNTAKAVIIVSDRAAEVAEHIMSNIHRGVTFLDGEGGFGHRGKKVIWCVVTTTQLSGIKSALRKIDPGSFMAIMDASEIVGKGFYRVPV